MAASDGPLGILLLAFFAGFVMQVVGFRILAPRGADQHHYTPAAYKPVGSRASASPRGHHAPTHRGRQRCLTP